MAHPFEKLFDVALRKSTLDDNLVHKKATELLEKGYRKEEVCGALITLEKSLIDDTEARIVSEAREEVCEEED